MVARIIPPKRLPCAWAGEGGVTTRVKRCTVEEDLREGVEERVQSGSTRRKVREWDGLVPSRETVMARSDHR